jgi:two-component system sensor histidine kinase KdpD
VLELTAADRDALLDTLRIELDRLERLVENLLDLSRLQAGAAFPQAELWTPDELAAQAVDELGAAARVVVDVPHTLPPVLVDAAQVQRVLVNLLHNALKFSPPGSPVVLAVAAAGGEVVFRVSDRGPGIPTSEHDLVFEPFHHARGGGGAGLGLAIARGFAGANGGRVWVEPAAQGATLALALPAAELPAGVPA